MLLAASRSLVEARGGGFDWLDESPSTNSAMLAAAAGGAPDFSVIATASQTAGRGRLGRTWVAPPGQTLAASVLLRSAGGRHPLVPLARWGWFPLIAGAAMARAVSELATGAGAPEVRAAVKWPNDVLLGRRKVCGILAEITADGASLVIGAGVNLTVPAGDLPTPFATSLAVEGVRIPDAAFPDAVLSGWLAQLGPLLDAFRDHAGDPETSGIRSSVLACCDTIGREVEVQLPAGSFRGTATGIDEDGRLVVRRPDGAREAVAAGDVTHLR